MKKFGKKVGSNIEWQLVNEVEYKKSKEINLQDIIKKISIIF